MTQLRQQAGVAAKTGRGQTPQPKAFKDNIPTPRQLRWWFQLPVERLSNKQQTQLMQLCQSEAEFALIYRLAQAVVALLHAHTDERLTQWVEDVQRSSFAELISFAKVLKQDEAAVRAGLSLHWSQGPVEGAVNRLKLIRRSMDGRANFDVLRKRVLCAA